MSDFSLPVPFQRVRYRLSKKYPFFSVALFAMVPRSSPGLGTMAVDKWWRLYYDPAIVDSWSEDLLEMAMLHELLHLIREHAERMYAFDPTVANLAADCEVNHYLGELGYVVPDWAVKPERFNLPGGLLAEEYAAELEKMRQRQQAGQGGQTGQTSGNKKPKKSGDSGAGKSGQTSGSQKPENAGDSGEGQSGQTEESPGAGAGDKPAPMAGRCGSAAHGHKEPWEDDVDGDAVSQSRAEAIRHDVARQMVEYAARNPGTLPADLVRAAEEILKPKVDFRRALQAEVRRAVGWTTGATDYSYKRPSRRQGIGGVILPSLVAPTPNITIIVDTSGSVADREIGLALGAIHEIIKSQNNQVTVMSCDTQVHNVQKVFGDVRDVPLIGGGGTDMGAGIEAALNQREKPDVIVVITDGFTPWPDSAPEVPVVVALIGGDNPPQPPEWARVIILEQ